jgi:SpoVK/Ycf46/Vps4 family AAA+-type ATPase
MHLRHTPCHADVSLPQLAASATAGFTGAEVSACCQEAALAALREHLHQRADRDRAAELKPAAATAAAGGVAAPAAAETRDQRGCYGGDERGEGGGGDGGPGSGGPVVCMRHLLAAARQTSPLLADPSAAARYAEDFMSKRDN